MPTSALLTGRADQGRRRLRAKPVTHILASPSLWEPQAARHPRRDARHSPAPRHRVPLLRTNLGQPARFLIRHRRPVGRGMSLMGDRMDRVRDRPQRHANGPGWSRRWCRATSPRRPILSSTASHRECTSCATDAPEVCRRLGRRPIRHSPRRLNSGKAGHLHGGPATTCPFAAYDRGARSTCPAGATRPVHRLQAQAATTFVLQVEKVKNSPPSRQARRGPPSTPSQPVRRVLMGAGTWFAAGTGGRRGDVADPLRRVLLRAAPP